MSPRPVHHPHARPPLSPLHSSTMRPFIPAHDPDDLDAQYKQLPARDISKANSFASSSDPSPSRTHNIHPQIFDVKTAPTSTNSASAIPTQSDASNVPAHVDKYFIHKFIIGAALFIVFYFLILFILQGIAQYRRRQEDRKSGKTDLEKQQDAEPAPHPPRVIYNDNEPNAPAKAYKRGRETHFSLLLDKMHFVPPRVAPETREWRPPTPPLPNRSDWAEPPPPRTRHLP